MLPLNRCLPITLCMVVFVVPTAGCSFFSGVSEQEGKEMLYGVRTVTPRARDTALQRRDLYLSRAQAGRKQYEAWANAHKAEILLLKEKPLTQKTFLKVSSILPSSRKHAGIAPGTMSDPAKKVEDLYDVRHINFSWEVPLRGWKKDSKDFQEFLTYHFKVAQDNNDYPLSSSMGVNSKSSVTLWASGRITEKTFVRNPSTSSGSSAYLEEVKEIQPPFDFFR